MVATVPTNSIVRMLRLRGRPTCLPCRGAGLGVRWRPGDLEGRDDLGPLSFLVLRPELLPLPLPFRGFREGVSLRGLAGDTDLAAVLWTLMCL